MRNEVRTRAQVRLVAMVVVAATVMTGCSIEQVRTWFAVRGAPGVSVADARAIADAINAKEPAGCDDNYAGACVPSNKSELHCIGEPGGDPEVTGPFRVTGWDHFGLDRDRDGIACEGTDPVGSLDVVGEPADGVGVRVQGWAFDHDLDGPIEVHFYDNGVGRAVVARGHRSDLAGMRRGPDHGFDLTWPTDPGVHEVCGYAINVGGGTNRPLGCRTIEVAWERYMLDLVNAQRASAGVQPLTLCGPLGLAAQVHTDDMVANGFFSHDSSSPDRRAARDAHIADYGGRGWGENIAAGYGSVAAAMNGWMNSPGHRENILRPTYTHLGVARAIVTTGYRYYWTQNFGVGGTC